ncbi:MAG: hypothetical protein LBL04_18200 [Bacteroidales bacterium]|nr:hypothetical protein [Bacteroidales bacterium]
MIRNMDKRQAGGAPAAADGTVATVTGLCCAKPLSGYRQNVVNSRNVMCNTG